MQFWGALSLVCGSLLGTWFLFFCQKNLHLTFIHLQTEWMVFNSNKISHMSPYIRSWQRFCHSLWPRSSSPLDCVLLAFFSLPVARKTFTTFSSLHNYYVSLKNWRKNIKPNIVMELTKFACCTPPRSLNIQ